MHRPHEHTVAQGDKTKIEGREQMGIGIGHGSSMDRTLALFQNDAPHRENARSNS